MKPAVDFRLLFPDDYALIGRNDKAFHVNHPEPLLISSREDFKFDLGSVVS